MFGNKRSSISIKNEGDGNTYNIQIGGENIGNASKQLGFLGLDAINDTNSALVKEFLSKKNNVLLCYPNKEDEALKPIIEKLKDGLLKIEANIFEGSGKIQLPDVQGYPHIAELDFIKNLKCDSIIIFVLDELTLSQLTLLSYYKIESNVQYVDIIAIPSDNIYTYDKFLSNGLIQYCDDNNCKVIKLSSFDDAEVERVIARVKNKKMIQVRRA